MILTARPVSADDGLRLGFVNEVVPASNLRAASYPMERAHSQMCPARHPRLEGDCVMRGLDEPSLAESLRNQHSYPGYMGGEMREDTRESTSSPSSAPPTMSLTGSAR